jgi:hypothetical protein
MLLPEAVLIVQGVMEKMRRPNRKLDKIKRKIILDNMSADGQHAINITSFDSDSMEARMEYEANPPGSSMVVDVILITGGMSDQVFVSEMLMDKRDVCPLPGETPLLKKVKIKSNYYVDPGELLAEIKKYKRTGEISEQLGSMFLLIAKRYVTLPRYYKYSYTDDFISCAVERMIEQLDKIDVNHPKCNPFFYLSRTCDNVCKAYIIKEGKFTRTKDALKTRLFDELEHSEQIKFKQNTEENETHAAPADPVDEE